MADPLGDSAAAESGPHSPVGPQPPRRIVRRALLAAAGVIAVTGGAGVAAALWSKATGSQRVVPTAQPETVHINTVLAQTDDDAFWTALSAAIAEQRPSLRLLPEALRLQDVLTTLAAGTVGELLSVPDSWISHLAATGGLAPVADLFRGRSALTRDRFVRPLFGAMTLEGALYGVPWRWGGAALCCDTAAWRQADLALPPVHWRDDRWSVDSFAAAVSQFQQSTAPARARPRPFQGTTAWFHWLPWLWLSGADAWEITTRSPTLAEPVAVTVLKRYAEWRSPRRSAGDEPAGDAAIRMVAPTWRTIGERLVAGRAVIRPLPQGMRRVTLLRADALTLVRAATRPDTARQALLAIITDAGQRIVAEVGLGLPAWRDVLAGRVLWERWYASDQSRSALRVFMDTAVYGQVPPYPSRWPEVAGILARELRGAFAGAVSMASATQRAAAAMRPVLAASQWP